MKEHFNRAIINLKQMVAQMAADAEEALESAVRAVSVRDVQLAEEVLKGDYRIDCEEIKIEEECLKILALYQPVASDLRTIVTILKVNIEIERIADMACNIAERVKDMAAFELDSAPEALHFDCSKMAERTREMLRLALDSMTYRNPELAERVIRSDDEIDALNRKNFALLRERIAEHPELSGYFLDCLTISKSFERIADVATNICEDVIYLERGKIIRHGNQARIGESHRQVAEAPGEARESGREGGCSR